MHSERPQLGAVLLAREELPVAAGRLEPPQEVLAWEGLEVELAEGVLMAEVEVSL